MSQVTESGGRPRAAWRFVAGSPTRWRWTVVVVLLILQRLALAEALALSLPGGYIFLPDDAFGRLLLVTLPFLLLLSPTPRQWATVWAVMAVAAIAAVIETQGGAARPRADQRRVARGVLA